MDAAIFPGIRDASVSVDAARHFGQAHFGGCEFGDRRLTHRAVVTADALMRHPGGSLPSKLPRAELYGFYDFANNVKVNHQNVLAAHLQRTRERMQQCAGPVLIIHDTTEGDYSGLSIDDLGPIGGVGRHRGLLIHNLLAVDAAHCQSLGLVGQILQVRRHVPKNESITASRQHPLRESRLWPKGAQQVGPPPAGATWINLMDRGGDSFESLQTQQKLGQYYVVRSCSNRSVRVKDSAGRTLGRKLHHWARRLPTLAERSVDAAANANQAARCAKVRIAAGPVQLQVPHVKCGEHDRQPMDAWVIHVREIEAPKQQSPLEWILLSNMAATTGKQACQIVDWYQCRPLIEEFHKAQKTGCGMEQLQFTTRKALQVSIAMLSVVAVQLLCLRDLARDDAERLASEVIDQPYVEALSLWHGKQATRDISAKQFLYILARLGGHQGRTRDRPPGWLVLWRGWSELQRLVEGMLLGRIKKCD